MPNKILLSIVIPTRNRNETARYAVEQAITITNANDIEIIIHDCGDDESLEYIVTSMNDNRIKYNHVQNTDMTDNWNQSMKYVRGEYFTIIGDDDAVLKNIIDATRWAQANNVDCITHPCTVTYYWPNYPDSKLSGNLTFKKNIDKMEYHKIDIENDILEKLSSNCGEFNNLPIIYHSVTRTHIFENVINKTGKYFDSMCPDIYSGYMLASEIKCYYQCTLPFTINGKSGLANSGRVQTNDRETIRKHFMEFKNQSWPGFLPISKDYHVLLAHTQYVAYNNLKMNYLTKNMNINKTIALCIISEPKYSLRIINDCICSQKNDIYQEIIKLVINIIIILAYKVKINVLLSHTKKTALTIASAKDIKVAITYYNDNYS